MEQKNEKVEKKKLFGNSKFFQKLKSIKHIEIIFAIILGAVVLLIYLSTFNSGSKKTSSLSATSTTEYVSMLEQKLENIVAKINGVGNASVMITLSSGPEYVYATDEETQSNKNEANGTTTSTTITTSSPVIISNEMVVIKEIMPKVGGVVVVASGAENTKVKLEIIKAIQALVDVPQANIEVLIGK